MSRCSKPGCTGHASAVLAYDYAARKVLLHDPDPGPLSPHVYAMCNLCAERLTPPRGWYVEDLRTEPPLFLDDELPRPSHHDEPAPEDDFATASRQLFFGTSA
jgi:hypothetical protein